MHPFFKWIIAYFSAIALMGAALIPVVVIHKFGFEGYAPWLSILAVPVIWHVGGTLLVKFLDPND
jgi:hypothetical protein